MQDAHRPFAPRRADMTICPKQLYVLCVELQVENVIHLNRTAHTCEREVEEKLVAEPQRVHPLWSARHGPNGAVERQQREPIAGKRAVVEDKRKARFT